MVRSKLIVSLFIGTIICIVLSLTASLAWYVSSSNLLVDNIYITMRSDDDLVISYTGADEDYVHDIEDTDRGVFSPVSSMFTSNWFDSNNKNTIPEFYHYPYETAPMSGIPMYDRANPDSHVFYQHEIYLKRQRKNAYMTLDLSNTLISPNIEYNRRYAQEMYKNDPDNGYTEEELYEQLCSLIKVMRISFLINDEKTNTYKYIIYDPYKEETTYLAGRLDNNNRTHYYDTYQKANGEDYEILYGEATGRENMVYGQKAEQDIIRVTKESDFSSFNANTKKGVHPLDMDASIANGLRLKEEPSITNEDILRLDDAMDVSEVPENALLIPVWARQENKMTVSIYLEGWDKDCVNATMGAGFYIYLKFKVLAALELR